MTTPRAASAEFPIEPDSTGSEGSDSATIDTDYASIASTIPNYVYQNGRRYHGFSAGNYPLPNDEREQERLDFLHHVFRLTLDGELCYTKLENPSRILDVGTGTGIWAMESRCPENVSFIVDDALKDWVFPESSFDFIHIRGLGGSIPDWPLLMRQCYSRLRSGGQIEVSEARYHFCCDDGTMTEDSVTRLWTDEFHRIAQQAGFEFDIFPKVAGWLRDAGFTDVDEVEKVVPVGTWPKDKKLKDRGRYFIAQFLSNGLETFSTSLLTRVGGWSADEMWKLLNSVSEEVKSNKLHIYTHFSFAIAKKGTLE
ncbi:hypothetical protein FQN57_005570 [Myotisia sp. PD_48]|nr:hypothetical protein FQN57_005570 [Myotisia sp. PD_48]